MRLIGRLNGLLWALNLALLAVALLVAVVSLVPDWSGRRAAVTAPPTGPAKGAEAGDQGARGSIDSKLILERDIFGTGPGGR